MSGINLKQQYRETRMPIQINEDWHKLQGLTDVSWFSVSLGLVTRLLLDLLESLQALLFQQQYNSAALWDRKQSGSSSSHLSVHFYVETCSSLEKIDEMGCS